MTCSVSVLRSDFRLKDDFFFTCSRRTNRYDLESVVGVES